MSELWTAIVLVTVGTFLIKGSGPVLVGGRELPEWTRGVIGLLAPALLTALVVVQTVGADKEIVLDGRLAGLGAAGLAIVLRAPLMAVVLSAVAVTAAARALGAG
jgi:branched-subunit amino acid transport protein